MGRWSTSDGLPAAGNGHILSWLPVHDTNAHLFSTACLQALGAEVQRLRPVSISHPDHFVNVARRRAAEQPNAVFADQFENVANFRAHLKTGGCGRCWVGWLGVPPLCNMPNQSELLAVLPIRHKHASALLLLFRPGDLGADGRPRGCFCQRRRHRRHDSGCGLLPEAAAAGGAGFPDRPTWQRPVQ